MIILVYVDDMLVTENNLTQIQQTKESLYQTFKLKDLGELKYFLGIEFSRSDKRILMNQRKYTLELISKLGLSAGKSSWTPLECNQKYTTKELDKVTGESQDDVLVDKDKYQD